MRKTATTTTSFQVIIMCNYSECFVFNNWLGFHCQRQQQQQAIFYSYFMSK